MTGPCKSRAVNWFGVTDTFVKLGNLWVPLCTHWCLSIYHKTHVCFQPSRVHDHWHLYRVLFTSSAVRSSISNVKSLLWLYYSGLIPPPNHMSYELFPYSLSGIASVCAHVCVSCHKGCVVFVPINCKNGIIHVCAHTFKGLMPGLPGPLRFISGLLFRGGWELSWENLKRHGEEHSRQKGGLAQGRHGPLGHSSESPLFSVSLHLAPNGYFCGVTNLPFQIVHLVSLPAL